MGKMKKKSKGRGFRNVPLGDQLHDAKYVKPTERVKLRNPQTEEDDIVDDKLSKKIIQSAIEQQEEFEEEFGGSTSKRSKDKPVRLSVGDKADSDDEPESDLEDDDLHCYEPVEVNEDDEKALQMFMGSTTTVRRTLADIIREKITEKQTEILTQFSDGQPDIIDLNPRVAEMFRGVAQVLAKYRSGKLPKAFKVIPTLSNWEQVLALTNPDGWSAAAMYQATRIFASNLKEKMAQRFFNLVLLPRIRDDISEFKKLNFHLYQALRKSLFKPGAFYKGILLPLCESGDCTLREAIIIGGVLTKNSIPVLHSSAALIKIAEMEYSGANSIFLRLLLDKKYALPYRVIDAVVYHFLKFQTDKRELPVLWHQALLVFVQRFKEDIGSEQKEALLELLRAHTHHSITAEVRRELQNSKCRDAEMVEPIAD